MPLYPQAVGINSIPYTMLNINPALPTVVSNSLYNGKPMYKTRIADTAGTGLKYGGNNFSVTKGNTYFLQAVVYDPLSIYRFSQVYHVNPLRNDMDGTLNAVVTEFGNGFKLVQFKYTADFTGSMTHGFIHCMNNGQDNVIYFGEVTIQENSGTTYEWGMKGNIRKDVLAPDILGTSHNFVSGNVYQVREDVTLTKAKFESLTEGSFNVAIYEWVEGTGKVGNPLYMKDMNVGIGVQVYNFGRVRLSAGKQYFIGRYEQTNAAAIKRVTGADIAPGQFVKWVGGTTLSQSTIIYPTSYYSFFAIEFEADPLKKAPLLPERNLIPDFNDPRWSYDKKLSVGGTKMTVDPDNPHRGTLTVGISAQSWLIQIPVKSGKTYTFQFGNITGLYRLLKGWTDSYNNVPIVGQDSKVLRITPDDTYNGYITLRLTHGAAGDYRFEDLLMVEGDYTTVQQFTPYIPAKMKPASLVPKKNLFNLPDLKETAWTVNALYKMYNLKPNTYYTISTNCPLPDNGTANIYFNGNSTASNGVYLGRSITAWSGSTGQLYVAIPYNPDRQYTQDIINGKYLIQLEEGSSATEIKPYELGMKPAKLYPKKNLINFDSYSLSGSGLVKVEETSDYVRVKTFANASGFIFSVGKLKPNTTYSMIAIVELFQRVDDVAQIRIYNRTKSAYISTGLGATASIMGEKRQIGGSFSTGNIDPSDIIEVWVMQTWLNGTHDEFEFKLYRNGTQLEEGSATPYEPYQLVNKPL